MYSWSIRYQFDPKDSKTPVHEDNLTEADVLSVLCLSLRRTYRTTGLAPSRLTRGRTRVSSSTSFRLSDQWQARPADV